MGLNQEQQDSYVQVINFLNDPNQKFMDVSGSAGTGKTYFISQVAEGILKHAAKDSPLHTVAITATTNKAAAVISQAMPKYASEISTVYSFMNLRVSENFSDGSQSIVPTKKWVVHSGIFLIVDECSMINADLFNYLEKGLDSTCKVLFVGDQNQLAPVKEELSPIYLNNYHTSFITKPVRNAGQPGLMALCEQAKQTVITGVFTPIVEVPGVVDFIDGPGLQGVLERDYLTEDPNKRVLCYTNSKVIQYNSFIRHIRGYTDPYNIGEVLSNNEAAELPGKIRLYTDQMFEVLSVNSDALSPDIVVGHDIRIITLTVKDLMVGAEYDISVFENSEDRREILNYYANNKKWSTYFKLKNQYPDLRSVAASTTHKAQGSTYDSVIVDLGDIGTCTNVKQTARMLYVALSRPKKHIFIKGELPPRYFK